MTMLLSEFIAEFPEADREIGLEVAKVAALVESLDRTGKVAVELKVAKSNSRMAVTIGHKVTEPTPEVKIPETFTLALRPFYGAEPVELVARLRWQLRSGKLTIGYELKRPDEVRRSAFVEDVVGYVADELAGVPMIHARPARATGPGR